MSVPVRRSIIIVSALLIVVNAAPNIVFIVADDLGWNDVGFHGSDQIATPNIDALAYSGVVLNNYYVNSLCTPSRSAIMTGKYPIHTGMQHYVLLCGEPRGLPLSEKLLPEYLKEAGYATHAVGKWHLGHYTMNYTPTFRGFDSHLGYWTGFHDYFDHISIPYDPPFGRVGLDMRRGTEPAWDLYGQYSTDVFTAEAVRRIREHDTSKPLFLYLAHAAVHSANAQDPLPAPFEVEDHINITNPNRRRFAAMLSKLDDSVGEVMVSLKEKGILEDTIIVFTTDNGGAPAGFNRNAASNWPLRGTKSSLWEGGVRGAAAVWSSKLKSPGRVSNELYSVTDWVPTLLSAANISTKGLENLDGMDVWESLSQGKPSPRNKVLHNIDPTTGCYAITVDEWKIHKCTQLLNWTDSYEPPGNGNTHSTAKVTSSPAGVVLSSIGMLQGQSQMVKVRDEATLSCRKDSDTLTPCELDKGPCLFNIKSDPCESNNLAKQFPMIVKKLLSELETYNKTMVPPSNMPIDPASDPIYWGHTWCNFGDYPSPLSSISAASCHKCTVPGMSLSFYYKNSLFLILPLTLIFSYA